MCSGTSPDDRLVEVIELPEHPYFVASQYHPEFKSRPNRPEPLFREFVGAALGARARARHGRAGEPARSTVSCSAWPSRPPTRMPPDARRTIPRSAATGDAHRPGRAHDTGQARLGDTFARLCEIESPSGSEARDGARPCGPSSRRSASP